ncbi:hypothetical protein Pyn_34315 [Prunus yedoensis var. nudiflora]|uniref:Uncharacterized protein n=1 Tax=Prunus yedoensis var. nudiflora TaxID=2094558 RepID=A0A314ZE90_PRUYE|nr:hypothetical protein Pyn_34315 [Prunus yedoensis var. nudiflora]
MTVDYRKGEAKFQFKSKNSPISRNIRACICDRCIDAVPSHKLSTCGQCISRFEVCITNTLSNTNTLQRQKMNENADKRERTSHFRNQIAWLGTLLQCLSQGPMRAPPAHVKQKGGAKREKASRR